MMLSKFKPTKVNFYLLIFLVIYFVVIFLHGTKTQHNHPLADLFSWSFPFEHLKIA